jgi:hypothetical protein
MAVGKFYIKAINEDEDTSFLTSQMQKLPNLVRVKQGCVWHMKACPAISSGIKRRKNTSTYIKLLHTICP